jgi:hypothetical protein
MAHLLDEVARKGKTYRRLAAESDKARDELAAAVKACAEEEIPYAAIARAAGFSREWIRKLAGR